MTDNLPSLFDAVDSARYERLWPHTDRKVYCLVSGRPYAVLHEDEVSGVIDSILKLPIERQLPAIRRQIDDMYLYMRPSPLWHSITPQALRHNRYKDLAGLTIFLLNRLFRPQVLWSGNTDNIVAWRRAQCETWAALNREMSTLQTFLRNLCDTIMLLDADGYIPQPDKLPWRILPMAADKDNLYTMHRTLQWHFKSDMQKRKVYNWFIPGGPVGPGNLPAVRQPSPIMKRTQYGDDDPMAELPAMRKRFINLALLEFERAFNPSYTQQDIGDVMISVTRTVTHTTTTTIITNHKAPEPQGGNRTTALKPGQQITFRRKEA